MSERVANLKKDFMSLRDKEMSFEEMTSKFDISVSTVYATLQEIADENGVSRKSLLYVPHKPHTGAKRVPSELDAVDIEKIGALFSDLINNCDELITNIDKISLKEETENGN